MPLALATLTKSSFEILRTIVRTENVQAPAETTTKVIIGNIACEIRSISRGNEPTGGGILYIPEEGRMRNSNANTIIRIIPNHQAGRA